MSIYRAVLPEIFPTGVTIPMLDVKEFVDILMSDPRGSSFAVTADAKPGFRNLWLSPTSHSRLIDAGKL